MIPQFRPPSLQFVIFLTGWLAVHPASAQEPASPAPPPQPVVLAEANAEEFIVGDWYKIRAKRRGHSASFEGSLVKVNDQWIALRIIREGRHEFAVPVASKLPFVGRLFRNVGIGRSDETLWIPREAATVEERTPARAEPVAVEVVKQTAAVGLEEPKVVTATTKAGPETQPLADERPPTGRACEIQMVGAKELEETAGEVFAVTDDVISLNVTRVVAVSEQIPLLGDLPMVGRAFRREHIERRQERRQVDRADILCLRISNRQSAAATVDLVPAPETTAPENPAAAAPAAPKR
ncbi:MAG TPA: hypothetical protein VGJ26_18525 [Pirellulales bacterium]|jgi:hypothetical protein